MKNNYLKAAYDNAPQFIRNFVSYVPFPLRMGRSYRETVAFLKKSQYWPNDAIKNYQLTQLKAVVDNAFKTVPYYKKKYKKLGLTGSSITSLSDFQRFPLLSRDDVLLNYNALKSSSYNNLNTYEGMTGGTTGASVKILFSMKSPFIEWGYIHALWSRIGFLPKHKRVALIGTPFLGNNRMTHCFNPFHNELQLSAIDLDESSIILYAKAISAFQPSFFYGLPSAWMVLGAFLLENNLIPKGIKGVLCGSEQITEDQRNFLESTFKCPVYSWYGQTEKVTLAGECECSQDYHIFFEYGYTELIDEQGDVINSPGKTGEIIATGFINSAMPLIRYRTGDMAQYADGNCPCRRSYRRFTGLIGRRLAEYIIGRELEKIPLAAIDTQLPEFNKIKLCQFVQTLPGQIRLNILANSEITANDINNIQESLMMQLAGRVTVEVSIVKDLVRTERGKVKNFIQNIGEV